MDYINIAEPFIRDEEIKALEETLTSRWLIQGKKVKKFEEDFSSYHNAKYGIATTSCTTSLHLALKACGVEEEDIVIVPSFTWIATANAVEYCKGEVVFCDSNLDDYNISIDSLKDIIERLNKKGKKPKAIIPVHLFGLCAQMDDILQIANQYNIKIIEDAACAAGAMYKDKYAGAIGDVGCFSFHPRKVITTGEGGMCVTNSKEIADNLNIFRNHGASISDGKLSNIDKPYIMPDFNVLGYNYRMTDLQGTIGIVQLSRLKFFIEERRKWANYYNESLASIEWLITPKENDGCYHVYQSYVCRVDEKIAKKSRNEIMNNLMEVGIHTRPGTHAIHELGYYKNKYNLEKDFCSNASILNHSTIALPLHNNMKKEDYDRVITALKNI